MGPSCLRVLTPEEAPCVKAEDCWGKLFCVDGKCSFSDVSSEPRSELGPEPKPEPAPDEPKVPDAASPDTKEPIKEVPPEPVPDTVTPVKEGQVKLYGACLPAVWGLPDERCAPGLTCVRIDGANSYCMKDCSKDASVCAQNGDRDTCRTFYWYEDDSRQQACVKQGKLDDLCSPKEAIFCNRGGANPAACISGKCISAQIVSTGASCNRTSLPPVLCDREKGLMCDNNRKCVRHPTRLEGDSCAKDSVCPELMTCAGIPADLGAACAYPCASDLDCTKHRSDLVCDGKFCVRGNCKDDLDCRYDSQYRICGPGSKTQSRICFFKIYGKVPLSGRCSANVGQDRETDCDQQFRCLSIFSANDKYGICATHCRTDLDCKRHDPRLRCGPAAQSGVRYCVHSCFKDTDCPTGMSCNANIQICGYR